MLPHWKERPPRAGRTLDWRDCQHCTHYNGRGNSGGTPPWSVCQFWPRRNPATCGSYAYEHRPWLNEDGGLWAFAPAECDASPVTSIAHTQAEAEGRAEPNNTGEGREL